MEKVGLLIDLGNSETRVCVVRKGVEHNFVLSNRMAKMEAKYVVPAEYRNNKSITFRYKGYSYANGAIVDKEFASKAIAPSAQQSKTAQLSTYTSLTLAFIKTYMLLAEEMNVRFEDVEVAFDVRIMLPPSEHDKSSEELKENISSINSVEVFSPIRASRPVTINSIVVLPEGATAYIGSVYAAVNGEMQIVPENEKFTTGNVLVIDIGAGTTDIVLIKDTELVVDSKETFKKGGNNVVALCKKYLYKLYDYFPSDKVMDRVLSEGMLVKGDEVIDVIEQLNASKESFGIELKNFLVDYLTRNDIEIRDVKGLLVVGGGTLPTIRDGEVISPSMAEFLINYIKELTSSISLVSLQNRNPRFLNMEGLKLYYRFTS